MRASFLILIIIAPLRLWSLTLSSDTEFATGLWSETLSLDGEFSPQESWQPKVWLISGTASSYRVQDEVTSETVTIRSSELVAMSGWSFFENRNNFDLQVNWGQSPEEQLTQVGLEIRDSHRFYYGDASHIFQPYVAPHLAFGFNNYRQNLLNSTRRTLFNVNQESQNIVQRWITFSIENDLANWFNWELGTTQFSYNRKIAEFARFLSSNELLYSQTQGISSLLFNLPKSETFLRLRFVLEAWQIDLSQRWTLQEILDEQTTSSKITLSRHLTSQWQLGVGVRKTKSSFGTNSSVLIGLSYSFAQSPLQDQ